MFDGELVSERARVTPDKIALVLVTSGQRITYRQLDQRVELAAATMRGLGLTPGDRVAILAHNCVEFIELFFGAFRAGIIAVPLSTRATAHELKQILNDCGAQVLFRGPEFENVANELAVSTTLAIDHRGPGNERSCEECGVNGSGLHIQHSPFNILHSSDETLACLLYTSGTTGKPKGVMISRRQLLWNGYNTVMNWGLREDDVSPIFTPLYHAGGLAAFLIPIFCVGGTIVLHSGFDEVEILQTIERERCTVVLGVPTIFRKLMETPEFDTVSLDKVRWFISGGAPLPAFIIEHYQRRGIPFKQGFGMTEVGVNCFTMTVEESRSKQGSIGKPLMFTAVRLVDEQERDVSAGEVGEMWIRGPHVSSGYWNNEEATRESYLPGGWFRTGDLARCDEDGFYSVAGRRKEMFISGGVNVYPAEIEGELLQHPDVSDAAVLSVPDETWGEVAVAFVVSAVSAEQLSAFLGSRLSKYKLPRQYRFVDVLPRTPYGKVLKEQLRAELG